MDSETMFGTVFALSVLLLVTVIGYGSFRLGVVSERKALTSALETSIKDAYWDGYTDALSGLRKPTE